MKLIAEPTCWTRRCKHFIGVEGREEEGQIVFCRAFPDGIPDIIAYGKNKHLKPLSWQKNKIVYEKEE